MESVIREIAAPIVPLLPIYQANNAFLMRLFVIELKLHLLKLCSHSCMEYLYYDNANNAKANMPSTNQTLPNFNFSGDGIVILIMYLVCYSMSIVLCRHVCI